MLRTRLNRSRRTIFSEFCDAPSRVGDLRGQAALAVVSAVVGNIPLSGEIRVRDFQIPAQFTVAISDRCNEQLTVSADYPRAYRSSVMREINVCFVSAGANLNLSLAQNYRAEFRSTARHSAFAVQRGRGTPQALLADQAPGHRAREHPISVHLA